MTLHDTIDNDDNGYGITPIIVLKSVFWPYGYD